MKSMTESNLPPHVEKPYLRIVGVCTKRPDVPGDAVEWGLAFQVLFPEEFRPYREVRAEIIRSDTGESVNAYHEEYLPGRCLNHRTFYNERYLCDNEYPFVYPISHLHEGLYKAEARLLDEKGRTCFRDSLAFKKGSWPRLKHRIELSADSAQATRVAGNALAGDFDADGQYEYVNEKGASHLSVYRGNGEKLWEYNDADTPFRRQGSTTNTWDVNGDGKDEILCYRGTPPNLRLCLVDGMTGAVLREIPFPVINEKLDMTKTGLMEGDHSETFERYPTLRRKLKSPADEEREQWRKKCAALLQENRTFTPDEVEELTRQELARVCSTGRIPSYLIPANFRGLGRGRDILVKIGEQNCCVFAALTDELDVLWTYHDVTGRCGHQADVGDVDSDGLDEVAFGATLLDHNGDVLWINDFADYHAPWEDDHVDEARIADIDGRGEPDVAYSCRVVVDGRTGKRKWMIPTWHGQQVFVGNFVDDLPGNQIVFGDREYRSSGSMMHGTLFECRDGQGGAIWQRRFSSMHPMNIVNWLPNDRTQVVIQADLARYPVKPNTQIFDDRGVLVDVLPILFTSQPCLHRSPRGELVAAAAPPLAGGAIAYAHMDVFVSAENF